MASRSTNNEAFSNCLRLIWLRWKPITAILVTLSVVYIYHTRSRPSLAQVVQVDKCPACYGQGACHLLNHVTPDLTLFSWLNGLSVKNVYMATSTSGRLLVLKKLAHDDELDMVDAKLCSNKMRAVCERPGVCSGVDLNILKECNVAYAAAQMAKKLGAGPLHEADIEDVTELSACPTRRMANRLADRYEERTAGYFTGTEKAMIVYSLAVNPEAAILQMFPQREGWPFPQYLGACGRLIMEERVGQPLINFFNAPWRKRVDLSRQILHIADQFTSNAIGFKLYWTDVCYDNLAVNEQGKVIVVDAEHIYVTDALQISIDKPTGYDKLAEHEHVTNCDGNVNCLQFNPKDWCTVTDSDFNYYAVCLSLLSRHSLDDKGYNGGLLHDLPDDLAQKEEIQAMLEECVEPKQKGGRLLAKDRLETLLLEAR